MSSGQYCLIRDLGLVKGGKGLRHHEVVLQLTVRGVFRFAKGLVVKGFATSQLDEQNSAVATSVAAKQ